MRRNAHNVSLVRHNLSISETLMPEKTLIEKLAYRLQNAAYSHGKIDAEDRWSDKKYREAADKSDAALQALLTEIREQNRDN